MVPCARRGAVAVTVFDLTPIRFRQYHLASNRFTPIQIRRRLERADVIIVPSASTASDLQAYEVAARSKIRIIPLGLNPVFRPIPAPQKEPLRALGLEGDFILAVGSVEPRKNLVRLLEAFSMLKDRHGIQHKLAIVGPEGWMQDEVRRNVTNRRLSDHVVFTGFVTDEILNLLYNAAGLLVYPSLYEGFGMPPLEAMAAGCPVAVSRVSSLPEVVGDAGVYLEPLDAGDIARAILQILNSPDLRSRLVDSGRRRSKEFSWQKTAAATLGVYRELCGK